MIGLRVDCAIRMAFLSLVLLLLLHFGECVYDRRVAGTPPDGGAGPLAELFINVVFGRLYVCLSVCLSWLNAGDTL